MFYKMPLQSCMVQLDINTAQNQQFQENDHHTIQSLRINSKSNHPKYIKIYHMLLPSINSTAIVILFCLSCTLHSQTIQNQHQASTTPTTITTTQTNLSPSSWQLPKTIWSYYHTGLHNAGPFLIHFYHHNLNILEGTGWVINVLNDSTLPSYLNVTEVNQFYAVLEPQIIQIKSDYIRLALLQKYGGVWMDLSCFLLEDMTWIQYISKEMAQVNEEKGNMLQVFMFTNSLHDYQRTNRARSWRISWVNEDDGNWFIAAIPHAQFITDWLLTFRSQAPFQIQALIAGLDRQGIPLTEYQHSLPHYFREFIAKTTTIARKQRSFHQGKPTPDTIRDHSTAIQEQMNHSKAIQEYKIWSLPCDSGPLLHESIVLFKQGFRLLYLTKYPYNQIVQPQKSTAKAQQRSPIQKDKGSPKYLVKIIGDVSKQLTTIIEGKDSAELASINNFIFWSRNLFIITGTYSCLNQIYILEGSLAHTLIRPNNRSNIIHQDQLSNYHSQEYLKAETSFINHAHVYKYQQIPWICHSFYSDQLLLYTFLAIFLLLIYVFLASRKAKIQKILFSPITFNHNNFTSNQIKQIQSISSEIVYSEEEEEQMKLSEEITAEENQILVTSYQDIEIKNTSKIQTTQLQQIFTIKIKPNQQTEFNEEKSNPGNNDKNQQLWLIFLEHYFTNILLLALTFILNGMFLILLLEFHKVFTIMVYAQLLKCTLLFAMNCYLWKKMLIMVDFPIQSNDRNDKNIASANKQKINSQGDQQISWIHCRVTNKSPCLKRSTYPLRIIVLFWLIFVEPLLLYLCHSYSSHSLSSISEIIRGTLSLKTYLIKINLHMAGYICILDEVLLSRNILKWIQRVN